MESIAGAEMVETSTGVHTMKFTKLIATAGLSATLIGTSLVLPVEALAGERGNRVSRNAGNRQGNRQSARSNRQTNRFAGPQNRQTSRQTNRGNRTTTFNENRQTHQTNRGGIDTNNRFPNREEAINNRTDRVTDRQDGRNHRVDSRQDGMNHRVDERNKTARKYSDKYWNGNGYYWSGGYYGGWYGPSYYNNWGWYNNSWGAFAGGAVLGALLTTALTNNTQYVVVPNTSYELYYDTIRTSGNMAYFTVDGRQTSVDCKAGTLNFKTPGTAAEAELVNAACIYAFGA